MGVIIDLTGQKFNRLTVIKQVDRNTPPIHRSSVWLCKCTCGNEVKVTSSNLRGGNSKSCGCLKVDAKTKHGACKIPEFKIWTAMFQRCYSPGFKFYQHYGGRNIVVCERWKNDFFSFYADMGPRPTSKHSIDRINVNGNYEPNNCRWATWTEQANNRRPRKKQAVEA